MTVQTDPRLDGYRSDGYVTMSMQTAMLRVPSIQLELPSILRARLLEDDELCDLLAANIGTVYEKTVTPWWYGLAANAQEGSLLGMDDAGARTSDDSCNLCFSAQAEVPLSSEAKVDDVFALLGGMADVASYIEDSNSTLQNQSELPALVACAETAKSVTESGPSDTAEFEGWCSQLLKQIESW